MTNVKWPWNSLSKCMASGSPELIQRQPQVYNSWIYNPVASFLSKLWLQHVQSLPCLYHISPVGNLAFLWFSNNQNKPHAGQHSSPQSVMRLVDFPQDCWVGHPEAVSGHLVSGRASASLLSLLSSLRLCSLSFPSQIVPGALHFFPLLHSMHFPFSETWGHSTLRPYVANLLP